MSATAPTREKPDEAVRPPDAAPARRIGGGLLDPGQLWLALPAALRKLNPVTLARNPVMFVTEIGAALTTGIAVAHPSLFGWLITAWLWLTVVFAGLAEAVAESRGRAQADTLRGMRRQTTARRVVGWEPGAVEGSYVEEAIGAGELRRGDIVVVEAGELVPGDGDVIEGVAGIDESAITGESAPVIRESGGDRSAVTGGRLVQRNALAMSGRAVEAAGDVNTLLLAKTGTVTYGNRRALAGRPARQQPGVVTAGTLQARGVNFVALATGAALVLALLNFLPALSLGPLAEGLQ